MSFWGYFYQRSCVASRIGSCLWSTLMHSRKTDWKLLHHIPLSMSTFNIRARKLISNPFSQIKRISSIRSLFVPHELSQQIAQFEHMASAAPLSSIPIGKSSSFRLVLMDFSIFSCYTSYYLFFSLICSSALFSMTVSIISAKTSFTSSVSKLFNQQNSAPISLAFSSPLLAETLRLSFRSFLFPTSTTRTSSISSFSTLSSHQSTLLKLFSLVMSYTITSACTSFRWQETICLYLSCPEVSQIFILSLVPSSILQNPVANYTAIVEVSFYGSEFIRQRWMRWLLPTPDQPRKPSFIIAFVQNIDIDIVGHNLYIKQEVTLFELSW